MSLAVDYVIDVNKVSYEDAACQWQALQHAGRVRFLVLFFLKEHEILNHKRQITALNDLPYKHNDGVL